MEREIPSNVTYGADRECGLDIGQQDAQRCNLK